MLLSLFFLVEFYKLANTYKIEGSGPRIVSLTNNILYIRYRWVRV